jgi:4-hydroxy-3-polyprenylbenzoate decarboxylase
MLQSVPDVETHVILTASAQRTIARETAYRSDDVRALADQYHNPKDIGAAVSSGSFVTAGMLVAPCPIKTLSGIAHFYNENLVVRAADVCLKERRRVVLMLRETPLHAGHIEIMAQATRNRAIIMPPVPAFYARTIRHRVARYQTVEWRERRGHCRIPSGVTGRYAVTE